MLKSYPVRGLEISAVEIRVWGLLLAGCAYWANVIRTGWNPTAPLLFGITQSISGNGAFAVAAWLIMVPLVMRSSRGATASGGVCAATFVSCLPAILPSEQTAMLCLLAFSTKWFRFDDSPAERAITLLLRGLAGNIFWTSYYMMPVHAAVGLFDARVIQSLLRIGGVSAGGYGNLLANPSGGITLEVLAQCASSFPLSSVCLAFIVTFVWLGQLPCRRHLGWLGASLLASIGLTELRLLWMARSQTDYLWLHDGNGVALYALAAVLLGMLFPFLATRANGEPDR